MYVSLLNTCLYSINTLGKNDDSLQAMAPLSLPWFILILVLSHLQQTYFYALQRQSTHNSMVSVTQSCINLPRASLEWITYPSSSASKRYLCDSHIHPLKVTITPGKSPNIWQKQGNVITEAKKINLNHLGLYTAFYTGKDSRKLKYLF